MRAARLIAMALMGVVLVSACGESGWRTKDISGLMPRLEFRLTGESGEVITQERVDGHVTLMFFGYTYCPDVCPNTMARLAAAMDKLPAEEAADVRVLLVSVDPDRDSPRRLREYTGAFGERFIGATGSQDQLKALNKRYRVTYGYGDGKGENDDYLVSHASATFVFDRSGEVRLLIRPDDSIEAIAADLRRLAG